MTSKRERGEETRRRVLAATAELIAEAGWSGFSTREIAARAGVAQGLVGYHWRSKGELVREAALAATEEALEPVTEAIRSAPSVREALERSLVLADSIRHEPQLVPLLFETMLQAGRDKPLRAALAAMVERFRTELAAALRAEGVEEPEALAAALAASLDGILLHAVVDDRFDVLAAGQRLLRLLPP